MLNKLIEAAMRAAKFPSRGATLPVSAAIKRQRKYSPRVMISGAPNLRHIQGSVAPREGINFYRKAG